MNGIILGQNEYLFSSMTYLHTYECRMDVYTYQVRCRKSSNSFNNGLNFKSKNSIKITIIIRLEVRM